MMILQIVVDDDDPMSLRGLRLLFQACPSSG
jgi:hypothetical protein